MRVTEQQRTVATEVVDIAMAVYVPFECALRVLHVDPVRLEKARVVGDAVGKNFPSALEQGLGSGKGLDVAVLEIVRCDRTLHEILRIGSDESIGLSQAARKPA